MRQKIVMCFVFMLAAIISFGQGRWMMGVNYSVAGPVGDFKNYVGKTSPRGWNANIDYQVTEKISAGLFVGFQDFYEKKDRALYKTVDGSDISAVLSNSVQMIPILANVRYQFLSTGTVQPYGALGIGANIIMNSQYLGEFAVSENKFGFAVRPAAGVFVPFRKESETGLNLSGAFNYMPHSSDNIDVGNLSHWSVGIGIRFRMR